MPTLREYLDEHKLSQRQLAAGLSEALGREVHHQYVGRWLRDPELIPTDVRATLALDEPPDVAGRGDEDVPPAAAPAAGEAPPKKPGGSVSVLPPVGADMAARITKFYAVLGEGVAQLDPVDGMMIVGIAPRAGEAWAEIAKRNPLVARIWNFLTLGGAWGDLAWIHAPVVVAILAHHGLLPELRLIPDVPSEPTHGQTPPPRAPASSNGADAAVGDAEAEAA